MNLVLIHTDYNSEKLEAVKAEMAGLGAPTIKAVYDEANDVYFALEGCHRIRAAKALGLTPEIEEIEVDDVDQDINEVCPGTFDDPVTFADILRFRVGQTIIEF